MADIPRVSGVAYDSHDLANPEVVAVNQSAPAIIIYDGNFNRHAFNNVRDHDVRDATAWGGFTTA